MKRFQRYEIAMMLRHRLERLQLGQRRRQLGRWDSDFQLSKWRTDQGMI